MPVFRHAALAGLLMIISLALVACAPAAESTPPVYSSYPPDAPASEGFRSDSPELVGATGRPQMVELYATF